MEGKLGKKCGFGACEESATAVVVHCEERRWVCGDHLYWLTARTGAKEIRCCSHGRWPTCSECHGTAMPPFHDNLVGNRCTSCSTDDGHVTGCRWLRRPPPASPPEVDPVPVNSVWQWAGAVSPGDYRREWRITGPKNEHGRYPNVYNSGPLAGREDVDVAASFWLERCTRLPDAPAPEAKPAVYETDADLIKKQHCVCRVGRPCFYHSTRLNESPVSQPQPTPPPAPAPKCGHRWTGSISGLVQECKLPPAHRGDHWGDFVAPVPAPYACPNGRPWCKKNDWCGVCLAGMCGDTDGRLMDAKWEKRQTGKVASDLPPARSYPAGELSWSGGGAVACRMTGRR